MALFPLDDDESEQPGFLMRLSDVEFQELMHDDPQPVVASQPSEVQLTKCTICREYAPTGSYKAQRCLRCGTAFVKPQHDLGARGGF